MRHDRAQTENNKKKYIKATVIGAVIGGITLILLLLCGSFVFLKMRTISEPAVFAVTIAVSCLSSFIAGFAAARIAREKGMLMGAVAAGILFLLVLLTGTMFSADDISLNTLLRAAAMILSGAFGGIFGVNKKTKRK